MSAAEPTSPSTPAHLTTAARADSRLAEAGERLGTILDEAVADGHPAGATLVVTDSEGELIKLTSGWSCLVGDHIATSPFTRYDLASLTKVTCTVPLVMAFAQRGLWDLDDTVASRLDGFPNTDITLRQLLTHTSGLPAHREFYRLPGGSKAIREAVYAEAAAALEPGEVLYSDLGFMFLGWALEQCAGAPLDELFQTNIASPLEMSETRFRPAPSARDITAATELDGDQRLAPGLVWNEVHDGNAWALGAVAGHAGLFAPADDLAKYVRAYLSPESHPVLSEASIAEMTRFQTGSAPDTRALGWKLDAREWGAWPESTFWHTGFTGTSLLIAPDLGVAVVLLMGGVHPKRQGERQQALRATVHREILGALA